MIATRRHLLLGAGSMGMALSAGNPRARADDPIRIGFLTVKTGPLASGGIQMEQSLLLYLKQRNNILAGRTVQLFTQDTNGVPATTRTKTSELVERDQVQLIIGPLAAFEALAIDDYTQQHKLPVMSVAAADDITQRHPDPYFVRCTSSSSQCAHPMADYALKELKYKRVAIIADDLAYGHEQLGGFMKVFEDGGGKVVQKLLPPLNAPDYGTYISQIKTDVDAVYMAFAGSNGFRFTKAFFEYGLGGKIPLIGGMTAMDEAILQQTGDDAIGIITSSYSSAQLDTPTNKQFVAAMQRDYKIDPGYYGAGTYISAAVLEAALVSVKGRIEDHDAFVKALRTNVVADTVRGPVRFDQFGNVIGNVYIRKVEKKGGHLVNSVIKTYPDVSQFWTYDQASFLAQPVYSRDFPAGKNIEG